MTYNLTGIGENSTGLLGFMQGVNSTLMLGWLGILMLIAIVMICFMAFMTATGDVKKAVGASSFVGFGSAIFLKAMSLIPDLALFICLVAFAGSIAFSFTSER